MKPAFSVIFFTTASGAGYGMLFWLGVLDAFGGLPRAMWFGPIGIGIAMALTSAGLLVSTGHLGRPEQAWRAISQWRTSWLSREGVAALLAYPAAAGFFAAWIFAGAGAPLTRAFGLLAAAVSVATIACTAMIYASLKPVREWHNRYILANYLLLGAFSGAACLAALAIFWRLEAARLTAGLGVATGLAGAASKLAYWRFIDGARAGATIESATGLGRLGPVRMLEAPNTEENYLLREMGFRIARDHAHDLRRIALTIGFLLPVILLLIGADASRTVGRIALPLASICALLGIYVERWLLFAQATHTVTLFYGRTS